MKLKDEHHLSYSLDFMYVILILINENWTSRIILRYGFLWMDSNPYWLSRLEILFPDQIFFKCISFLISKQNMEHSKYTVPFNNYFIFQTE